MGAIGRCLIFKRSASTSPTRRWARRMTYSPDRDRAIGPLPPALSSMWRLCKLGYRHEPRLMLGALGLSQLAALPDALLALWLGVTMALLASIHPALLLLAVFAVPTVLTSTWRPQVERSAQERGAQANRLARHLFTIATTAPPGKEVRVTGIGERLVTERRAAWEHWYGPVATSRWGSAWWHALAWAIFGFAYVGAVVFVSSGLGAPASQMLL